MTEHLYAVLVLVHAGGIASLIDILNNILYISAYILPGLSYFLQIGS